MNVSSPYRLPSDHQAFPNVVSTSEQSNPDTQPGMFVEQHAGFEFPIPANQHRRTPSIGQSISGHKVFRFGGEIFLLAAASPKLQNLGQVKAQCAIPAEQSCLSRAVDKGGRSSHA